MNQASLVFLVTLFSLSLYAQSDEAENSSNTTTASIEKHRLAIAKTQFVVGLQTATFKYTEPGLMTDTSQLNGVRLGLYTPGNSNFIVGGEIEYLTGTAAYDGAYQDGRKLKTSGTNSIATVRGLLGVEFETSESSLLTTFGGLGVRQLANKYDGPGTYRREIGYTYLPLGLTWKTQMTERLSAGITAEYDLFVSGTVKTHLSDVDSKLPDIENKQSSGSGYRISANLDYQLSDYTIGVQPFYHVWNVADSDKFYATDGKNRYAFYEPKNETTMVGLDLNLKF